MNALSSLSPEEIAVEAFLAGNDLLLYGDHIGPNVDDILGNIVPKAISGIKNAYLKGIITEEDINHKVRKILLAKEKLGLFEQQFLEENENLLEELNSPQALSLKAKLFEEAITLVENQDVLPLSNDGIYAAIGDGGFCKKLNQHANVQGFSFQEKEKLLNGLSSYSHIIVSIENVNPKEKNYGISQEIIEFLHLLHEKKVPVILAVFGTPYSLRFFDTHPVMMVGYENDEDAFRATAEILFGKRFPKGKLPVTIDERYPAQTGLETWTK